MGYLVSGYSIWYTMSDTIVMTKCFVKNSRQNTSSSDGIIMRLTCIEIDWIRQEIVKEDRAPWMWIENVIYTVRCCFVNCQSILNRISIFLHWELMHREQIQHQNIINKYWMLMDVCSGHGSWRNCLWTEFSAFQLPKTIHIRQKRFINKS